MRACVHIVALPVALLTVLTSCRPNPGFALREDGADSTGREGTDSGSASDSSTGAELCEPVSQEHGDLCAPMFELLPLTKYVVNFSNAAILRDTKNVCGVFDGFLVKRVGDELQRCDAGCSGTCDAATALNVEGLANIPNFSKLLPPANSCATMWHISRINPDPMPDMPDGMWTPCVTSGFLLMDDTPERKLRVAVTFDSEVPDPFADQPDAPLTMTPNDVALDLCANQIGDTCLAGFTPKGLTFSLGRCTVDTYQSLKTTKIHEAGDDYTLELHNAYLCIDNRQNYRWWIHRDF